MEEKTLAAYRGALDTLTLDDGQITEIARRVLKNGVKPKAFPTRALAGALLAAALLFGLLWPQSSVVGLVVRAEDGTALALEPGKPVTLRPEVHYIDGSTELIGPGGSLRGDSDTWERVGFALEYPDADVRAVALECAGHRETFFIEEVRVSQADYDAYDRNETKENYPDSGFLIFGGEVGGGEATGIRLLGKSLSFDAPDGGAIPVDLHFYHGGAQEATADLYITTHLADGTVASQQVRLTLTRGEETVTAYYPPPGGAERDPEPGEAWEAREALRTVYTLTMELR